MTTQLIMILAALAGAAGLLFIWMKRDKQGAAPEAGKDA